MKPPYKGNPERPISYPWLEIKRRNGYKEIDVRQ